MKRSLLVGLSLSFVLFTMAASITSTVAWFSSSRVAYTSAGEFEVVQIDGTLDCELEAGVGTRLTADGKHVLVDSTDPDVDYALLDGSVDLDTGHAYRPNREGPGYEDLNTPNESKWMRFTETGDGTSTNCYVAVSWTILFTYEFRFETAAMGVYLNLADSLFTPRTPTKEAECDASDKKSQLGFRIAFLPEEGNHIVLGNNPAPATSLNYVVGEGATDRETYSTGNYFIHDSSYSKVANGPGNTGRPERLCTLTRDDPTMRVLCVAWFEGEDPNVVSGTQMDVIDADLSFYVRSDA